MENRKGARDRYRARNHPACRFSEPLGEAGKTRMLAQNYTELVNLQDISYE